MQNEFYKRYPYHEKSDIISKNQGTITQLNDEHSDGILDQTYLKDEIQTTS